jgi:hypothetical protein
MSRKTIGIYVLVVGILQAALYVALAFWKDSPLFYFDPRIGIFFLEVLLFGERDGMPGPFSWASLAVLLAVGLMLVLQRIPLKVYVVVELILAAPSVLFFVMIVCANMSPAHGFSVGELMIPVPVFIIFSVVPLAMAAKSRAKKQSLS